MREIKIGTNDNKYFVFINNTLDKIHLALKENKITSKSRLFLITDDKVFSLYKKDIYELKKDFNIKVYYFKNGEKNKNIKTIQSIYNFLLKNKVDRKSTIIALGGGVVGDLVGFVASTYMRGINFVNIPTTFLSQVDSCIGGKVGYNYNEIKNCIGNFYNPKMVYIPINYLKTEETSGFLSGLGEVIKYSLIYPSNLMEFLNSNYNSILNKEHDKLIYIISQSLKIKNLIVNEDKKDYGKRNVLNFGHTIGHGIESISNYEVSHGMAVSLGILVSLKLSTMYYELDPNIYNGIINLYKKFDLPIKYKINNYDDLLYNIKYDKKNSNGNINMVLLKGLGETIIKVPVKEKDIIKAIEDSIGNIKKE